MLTRTELLALHGSLRDRHVLSVYIDGSATDPAIQRSWRLQLDHGLTDLRRWLEGSTHAEREEFDHCVQRLRGLLEAFSAGPGAPGWAAFITADAVHDAQPLPAPAPTLAVWSTGPCIAPYMRAMKEGQAVVVIVADARKAAIYDYRRGELARVRTLHAYHVIDQAEHMGTPSRLGFHSGTRGRTGHDAAQRALLTGRDRMIADAADLAIELAGADGWIVVGGIKREAARLSQLLSDTLPHRVLEVGSLDVHASAAQVTEQARLAASQLRNAMDDRRINDIVDLAGAHGLGAVGPAETRQALEQRAVRDLYVTHQYVEDHAAEAEQAIRSALDQDASVEEASGVAADRLNRHGGMVAGLRFRPASVQAASP